jgi:hypothetical protein
MAIAPGVIITLWWLGGLSGHFGTAVPGAVPGDNLTFVWNVWWTRHALVHGLPVLSTPLLFYPFSADLTLHTHTLLPALAVSGIVNPIAAQNVLVATHLVLNFACMYALGHRETHSTLAALTGAIVFGCSPFLGAHLGGHFNLIAAWALPLAALLALRAVEMRSFRAGIAVGLSLGATAYVDYYFFIYASVLVLCLSVGRFLHAPRAQAGRARTALRTAAALLLLIAVGAVAVAGVVGATGGGLWRVGTHVVSMRSPWGPLTIAWICTLLAFLTSALRTRRLSIDFAGLAGLGAPALGAAVALAIVIAPLAVRGLHLLHTGGYVTQSYRWRSAPAGIDLMTLVAGNPRSLVYGSLVRPLYGRAHVNLVEHVGWLGPGLIALCFAGVRATRRHTSRRAWLVVALVFGIWAIGPFLQFAGHTTPLWMPAVALRWIPFVANARIPARAMVVVYLALAMLAAFGARHILEQRRGVPVYTVLVALLLADYVPAQEAVTYLERPHTVDVMAAAIESGAVLPVPLGLKDGFGETGELDPLAMWLQTLHARPIAGGFIARLPPNLAADYRRMPVLGSLLRLSDGDTLTEEEIRQDPLDGARIAVQGFRYVLVHRARLTPTLAAYLKERDHLERIAADETYDLFATDEQQ